jgi:hypothetical protein
VRYVACRHCGSEYFVQRRGNTIGLEPYTPEQFELSQKIAEVERSQGEGCSNVFFWIFLVAGIFFCGIGFISRELFDTNVPLVIGWAISMLALVVGAGVVLRVLNTQRAERLKLEAEQRELYQKASEEEDANEQAVKEEAEAEL